MLSPMTDGAVSVPPAPEEQFPHVNPQVYRLGVDGTFLPLLRSGMRRDTPGPEPVPSTGPPLCGLAMSVRDGAGV